MNEITVLLAFALPVPELAGDLLRNLKTPALASLLGHAKQSHHAQTTAYARALPHEVWLNQAFFESNKLPAKAVMQALGLVPPTEHCFMLNPVHIHIARDHLILTDPRQLALSEAEAQELFRAAVPYFAEQGMRLIFGTAQQWFVAGENLAELDCASLDAACGHNIDIWLPRQAAQQSERAWRKLQNEIQMLWYAHPINEARLESGLPPVNALWLSGANTPVSTASNLPQGLFRLANVQPPLSAQSLLCTPASLSDLHTGIVYVDQLSSAGLAGDWGSWLEQMHILEEHCFTPLLQHLRSGKTQAVRLLLTDSAQILEFSLTPWSLRWPWRKASLQGLQQARPNTSA